MSPELLALVEEKGLSCILDELRQYAEDKSAESFPDETEYEDISYLLEEAFDLLTGANIR